jgi:hypothetical protein
MQMKKTIIGMALMIAVSLTQNANAQKEKPGKVFTGGFGIETGLVTGDPGFKSEFSSEFGLSARFGYKVGPGWITLTPGGNAVFPKSFEDEDLKVGTHYYVKAGYKYIFVKHLFAMAEVGYGNYSSYTEYSDDGQLYKTNSSGGICFSPAIGGNFGSFELGLRYEYTKLSGGSKSIAGLRLGWNF